MVPYEKEFERALSVFDTDTLQGIPKCLISDPYCDLSSIMYSLGVSPTLSEQWKDILMIYSDEDPWSLCISTMGFISESVIPVCKRGKQRISPPSDQKLKRLLAFLIGTSYWLSAEAKDPELGKKLQALLNKTVTVSFSHETYISKTKGKLHTISWSLSIPGELKTVYMDDMMALIGSSIRVWHKLLERSNKALNPKLITSLLSKATYLSWNKLATKTGCLDLLSSKILLHNETISVSNDMNYDSDGSPYML